MARKMIKTIMMILIIIGLFSMVSFSEISESHLSLKICKLSNDDSLLFRYGLDIEMANEDIIVLENVGNKLYKYRLNGGLKFIKTIGQKGKGPSDLNLPTELSLWAGVIAVKDEEGISFFDTNGVYLDKFRLFSPRISFVFVKDRIYFASSIPGKNYLIGVYTKKGKLLKEFGEKFLKINPDHHKKLSAFSNELYFYSGKLLSDGNFIYYLNAKFGYIIKYDPNGKKVLDKDISSVFGENGKRILNENNDMLRNGIKLIGTRSYPVYKLFKDAYLFKEKIYILTSKSPLPNPVKDSEEVSDSYVIVLCKNTLKPEKKMLITLSEDEDLHSLAVAEKDGKIIFYAPMFTKEGVEIAALKEEK